VVRVARPAVTATSVASVVVAVGAAAAVGVEPAAVAPARVVEGAIAIAPRQWTSGPRGGPSRRLLLLLRLRPLRLQLRSLARQVVGEHFPKKAKALHELVAPRALGGQRAKGESPHHRIADH